MGILIMKKILITDLIMVGIVKYVNIEERRNLGGGNETMSYKKGYIGRGKEVHYVKQGWHRGKMWPWWSYWRSLCGREGGIEFTDKPGTCKICLKHRSIRV